MLTLSLSHPAGALLSEAVPILVLPDSHAEVAAELARMPACQQSASVLRLVAAALAYLQAREAATGAEAAASFQDAYPPLAVTRVAAAARTVLSLAEQAGWPALAHLLQPAAVADGWHPARAALQSPDVAAPEPAAATAAVARPAPASAAAVAAEAADVGSSSPAAPAGTGGGKAAAGTTSRPSSAPLGILPPAGGKAGSAKLAEAGLDPALLPELREGESLRCAMHPAVLGVVTVVVAGLVLGMGVAVMSGRLG